MNIVIRKQNRKSIAFRLTPKGAVVLIPHTIDAESQEVSHFIQHALDKLPLPNSTVNILDKPYIHQLIGDWSVKLKVEVKRIQIRQMQNKWGSISTNGTLTLAHDLMELPYDLVEYIIVHELLHLKFPNHYKGFVVSMGMYLRDWRERDLRLQAYVVKRATC